jgi:hypothetical protein
LLPPNHDAAWRELAAIAATVAADTTLSAAERDTAQQVANHVDGDFSFYALLPFFAAVGRHFRVHVVVRVGAEKRTAYYHRSGAHGVVDLALFNLDAPIAHMRGALFVTPAAEVASLRAVGVDFVPLRARVGGKKRPRQGVGEAAGDVAGGGGGGGAAGGPFVPPLTIEEARQLLAGRLDFALLEVPFSQALEPTIVDAARTLCKLVLERDRECREQFDSAEAAATRERMGGEGGGGEAHTRGLEARGPEDKRGEP